MSLNELLQTAGEKRVVAIPSWEEEGSDSYRLFHGAVEGRPGLSVDRYGALTLAQISGSSPLSEAEWESLRGFLSASRGAWVLAQRDGKRLLLKEESASGLWSSTVWCRELGLEFAVDLSKAHRDPQLFLDFRAAKRELSRRLSALGTGRSVLNLFAYTCSISCHALKAGAAAVWSVDFSSGNLAWGEKNFRRNRLVGESLSLTEDCIGALWALTGRGRRKKLTSALSPRLFDVVVVDPPAFSKGKFATVDLVNDPETVFGPAWDVVASGGLLVAANNSAEVNREDFEHRLRRLFAKRSANGACADITWVTPDHDFPSFDGEPPLKVAFCQKL